MSGTMLYQPGKTFLHRADARAKIAAIIVVLVVALTTTRIDVLVALTAVVVIGLAALARITPASYAKALLLIIPLVLLLTLLQALVQGGPAMATIGGLSLSRAGVLLGLGIGMRLFAMGICFYGFSVTTSPSDIALALHKVGVPYKFAYLTSFAFRFLPLLQDEARTLLTAMAVRGSAESSSRHPLRRGRAIVRMLFPMLAGSMKRSSDIALSMELRGYSLPGPRTFYRTSSFRAGDALLVIGVVLLAAALLVMQWQMPAPFTEGA
ncbi:MULTISPECIES: energy-coupling factor transporter transmembrane component T [unclassified Streptomyces]|uniref:energy-coupling factor transporter transmembrane component T family protein n=1 Tax=Streptomyces TaxID=1883 RepID=UPI0001C1BAF9|nr:MULTISPECIES: energy-coupling factor transporter transmembrane component T [unclassified Streptomyces]AEN08046.1 cobalt transport protein [Streptomyces sp. SirexAA-E]MYR68448.1 energy-coupling factor transporter transmembrane protein EcfT [Streptomyces sp. SID4939]MYS04664.1 energy-coupling factor transporter transmembrane protein EcfT [Streptomyces sp. SID4940]MYT66803.1 energy-coupling factor transporter transmembrane protein EcfT [Streptomyces sp. SID8357]MYT83724.1 energy-coupling facto